MLGTSRLCIWQNIDQFLLLLSENTYSLFKTDLTYIFFSGMYLQNLKRHSFVVCFVRIQREDIPKSIQDGSAICQKSYSVRNNHLSQSLCHSLL